MADPQQPKMRDESGALVTPKVRNEDGTPLSPKKTSGFWASFWKYGHPKVIAEGIGSMGELILNPPLAMQTAWEMGKAGRESFDAGKPLGAIPFIGMPAQEAADQIRAGDYAGAAGTMTGAFGPMLLGEVMPASRNIGLRSRNPSVAAAGQRAMSEGVPLGLGDLGVRKWLGRMQYAADATSLMGLRDWAEPVVEGFQNWSRRLVDEVRPGRSVTPEEAGASVTRMERGKMAAHGVRQDVSYGGIRQIAERHVESRPVQRLDPDGNPVTVMVDMAAPVDMRPVKAALQPIVDRLKALYRASQLDNQPGYGLMQNILDGDDFVPLDTAMEQLSAVGKRQQGSRDAGLRTKGEGRAAFAWDKLNNAVKQTIDGLGDDAVEANRLWAQGKAATKAKFQTAEELKALGQTGDIPEGAAAYARLVKSEDKSIGLLSRINRNSPAEVRNIGRAWLEERIRTAFRHGDVERARAILKDWEDLGDKTRNLLFPDAQMQEQIGQFLLSLKTWAESPNPSGTGAINAMMQAVKPVVQAVAGLVSGGSGAAAGALAPGALPYLAAAQGFWSAADLALHSNRLARLVTRGLTTPARGPLRAVGQMGTAGALVGSQPAAAPRISSATAEPKPPTEEAPDAVKQAGPGIHTLDNGSVWRVDADGTITKLK